MSSTHIQFDRDRVVSVQTQSITARSSTRKGTRRNLHTHTLSIHITLSIYSMLILEIRRAQYVFIPLEEKQVEVVVFLGKEVAEDTSGISTADLIGWQAEVNALDKVPELGHKVLIELPEQWRGKTRKTKAYSILVFAAVGLFIHMGSYYQNIELTSQIISHYLVHWWCWWMLEYNKHMI